MAYPNRPHLEPLPQFRRPPGRGTARPHTPELVAFVCQHYAEGRSLRELGELTDRAWREVANILDRAGVGRRPPGAQRQRPMS